MSEQPRRHQGADRAAVGQEPRAGQRRTKSALVRQERCLFWRVPAAKAGQRRSYADTTLLLWPLVRQDRQRIWRRTVDRGGQNGLRPWSFVLGAHSVVPSLVSSP